MIADKGVLTHIKNTLKVKNVLDVGANGPSLVEIARDIGLQAKGIDPKPNIVKTDEDLVLHDIERGHYEEKFDLMWCTGIMDNTNNINNLFDTFKNSKYVFVNFIPRLKGGKDPRQWTSIFATHGFEVMVDETLELRRRATMSKLLAETGTLFRYNPNIARQPIEHPSPKLEAPKKVTKPQMPAPAPTVKKDVKPSAVVSSVPAPRDRGKNEGGDVLIIGSGPSARLIDKFGEVEKPTVVAVNHGWLATPDWDYWVRAGDFKGQIATAREGQKIVKTYRHSLGKYGGQAACGYSVILNAAYWVLDELRPERIFFLGCDMNYEKDKNGHTTIYGVGEDIKKNGISDPDRMANMYAKNMSSDEYIEFIYNRFAEVADGEGTKLYNLSNDKNTRLPYRKYNLSRYISYTKKHNK